MNGDITPGQPRRENEQPLPPPAQPRSPAPFEPSTPAVAMQGQVSETPAPQPPRRKKTLLRLVAGVLLAVVLLVAALVSWYMLQLGAVDPSSSEKIKVTIQPGSGVSDISAELKKQGLIRSEVAFDWYLRLNGLSGSLQSGAYRLAKAEDVPAIVGHLTSGKTDSFSLTFLPGNTLAKHRQAMIDAGYEASSVDAALAKQYDHPVLEGKPQGADLEGYIYGETYNFPADATPESIVLRTLDQFQSVVEENDFKERFKEQGFSLFQGITMASIIQREVITAEDAAQVAQVFKTRFDSGMMLGSDVTYQYIADKTGQERRVDLDSTYNTRRYTGLPPGPISSPGLASLQGVARPADGDFLFFLSGDDDKTYFARTNEEHERNIREHCQEKCQII